MHRFLKMDLEVKQTAVTESSLLLLRLSHFLLQMLQMAADFCLIFGFSLELIWAVFVAGFVIFVEEQQITLFLDNLIVSLKIIFTVFSAAVTSYFLFSWSLSLHCYIAGFHSSWACSSDTLILCRLVFY